MNNTLMSMKNFCFDKEIYMYVCMYPVDEPIPTVSLWLLDD